MAPLADAIAEVWLLVVVFSLIILACTYSHLTNIWSVFLAMFDPKKRDWWAGTYSLKNLPGLS
jgi:hypothetical protein